MGRFIKNRVSVVTPVYNGEKHLYRLLESVLAQSWEDVEMILSDDGSQDGTLAAARAFRDRFRRRGCALRIVTGEHRNASAAINRALPLATGEYLIWPDSDDELHPSSIRRRADFLAANPQYQCVRSLGRYLGPDGGPCPPQENMADWAGEELFFPVLTGQSFVCCGCYMLRCEAFFAIYPRRQIPEYDVGQNFQMLLPFLYRHRCPTIPEALYTVHVSPDSHSRRPLTEREEEKKYADFEDLVDELAALCPVESPGERRRIALWKMDRRYALALRHNQRGRGAAALVWLLVHGGMEPGRAAREAAKLACGPRVRRLWRRLREGREKGG